MLLRQIGYGSIAAVVILSIADVARSDDAAVRKIVVLAGKKSHGPEGNGIHDYGWSAKAIKVMLDNSNVADRVRVEIHENGWPTDVGTFEDAHAIMIVSDGRDGEVGEEALHLSSPETIDLISRQIRRGCGIVTFHFSTFAPDRYAEQVLDWVGGYFDWETDGKRDWYSAIQVIDDRVEPAAPAHPICRGVQPFRMQEEFYYNLRFHPVVGQITPILTVPALPGREPDGRVVAWARERADGGRGFGTTCGHFYENWRHPEFRKVVLNGLIWAARADVPREGVESRFYPRDEIAAAMKGVVGAQPAKIDDRAIRVLLFAGNEAHKWHNWETTTPVIREVLERDPRVRVEVSLDIEDLARRDLADYQTIVLNYCNWHDPTSLSDDAKRAFTLYLQRGGGLVVVHFANGAFHYSLPMAGESDWPEYRKIVRRVWNHHGEGDRRSGHDAFGPFHVEIANNEHPIVAGLAAFDVTDELYFQQDGDDPLEPLLFARSKITGKDEPLAFAYRYGDGRVYQTLLGHSEKTYEAFEARETLRRAVAWTANRFVRPLTPLEDPIQAPQGAAKTNARPIDPHYSQEALGFPWTEEDSVDNRWSKTDVGPFLASTVRLPDIAPVGKGLSIRVGDDRAATVLYDTLSCTWRAAWTGGFLRFDPARFGLITSPSIAGELRAATNEYSPCDESVTYQGFFHHGERVVLSYRLGTRDILEHPWSETFANSIVFSRAMAIGGCDRPTRFCLGAFRGTPTILPSGRSILFQEKDKTCAIGLVADKNVSVQTVHEGRVIVEIPAADHETHVTILVCDSPAVLETAMAKDSSSDPRLWMRPGPRQWPTEPVTRGVLGQEGGAYVVDQLTLPFDNPYRALFFVSGHDFFSNGQIAVCTVHGDVWIASGVDAGLERLVWKRFATGLFQPLGLRVIDDVVYVLGRDQITRLTDVNRDGQADRYECFHNAYETSAGGHDYVACLETDAAGNFYFVHALQGLVRVSADGVRGEVLATGFRNPNGLGVLSDGTVTVAPQEGEWTPSSAICTIRPGGHYGYRGPQVTPERPLGYDPPLCWIPRLVDNSGGDQFSTPAADWGPLSGRAIHLSYGQCKALLVLRESFEGIDQGGVVPLPFEFPSGVMRGRVNPRDGQVYVSGLKGWVTSAVDDGCLCRVRWTGRPMNVPIGVRTYSNGLAVQFSRALDKATAEDPDRYGVQAWNYRYSAAYGSADYRPSKPDAQGRDEWTVASATLLDDAKTVFLEIPDLQPVMQLAIAYQIRGDDHEILDNSIYYTIHRVAKDSIDSRLLARRPRPGKLPDEIDARLAPGLRLRFEQDGQTDTRSARILAWAVPDGVAPTQFLGPGSFRVVASGYLKAPAPGAYRFSFDGSGSAELTVNGHAIMTRSDLAASQPATVDLHKGYNAIELRYSSPADGPSSFRVLWECDAFAREPLPPTALFHDSWDVELRVHSLRREGGRLWELFRCANCHEHPFDRSLAAPLAAGPDLTGILSRLDPEWIATWLSDPSACRPRATMPAFFDSHSTVDQATIADIVAYLATPLDAAPSPASAGSREDGLRLYEDLGCIACHRFSEPAAADVDDRISLVHVGGKFQPGRLEEFLSHPSRHYAETRMPDFQLSEAESASLAAYLRSHFEPSQNATWEGKSGDPGRGKEAFTRFECARCHNFDGQAAAAIQRRPIAPKRCETGCLAAANAHRGSAPRYEWAEGERIALIEWIQGPAPSPASSPADAAQSLMSTLNCQACHARDGKPAAFGRILVEESEIGLPPEVFPDLTWAGEKLRSDWMHRQFVGELGYRSRPWLKGRMPAFPAHSAKLARAIAAEHGHLDPGPIPNASANQEEATLAMGERLVSAEGGLDCVSCHAVGRIQPRGDDRTQISPGINFSHLRDRMREEHYLRFVLDPPRYDVATRMPKLVLGGKRTKVRDLLDGDAHRQFNAIWRYIQSLPEETTLAR